MKIRRKILLVTVLAVLSLFSWVGQGICGFGAFANLDIGFHGDIRSTGVLRDVDGFQYGFLNDSDWVQFRNQFKFDLILTPKYVVEPRVRVKQVYISYRAAYDAIFDLENRYDQLPNSRRGGDGSRYDLGLDDVIYENDLREFFVDTHISLNPGTLNCRLGRQIVLWGEADGFNLVNVVNPQDYRSLQNFDNPDDLAAPIWMGRFDYNHGHLGPFSDFSLQFLAIPDNRPTVFGPASATAAGPYSLFLPGLEVYQNDHSSGFGDMQFAARLGLVYDRLQVYGYYFNGFQAGPAINFSEAALGRVWLDHPDMEMVGFSFNYAWFEAAATVRGEGSMTDELTFMDFGAGPKGYKGYRTYQMLLAFGKDLHPKWIGTRTPLTTDTQIYWRGIQDYDDNRALRPGAKENAYRATLTLVTDYYNGRIKPTLYFLYDTEGVLFTAPSLEYSPNGRLYYKVSSICAFGDTDAISDYVSIIGSSEISFRVGYRW